MGEKGRGGAQVGRGSAIPLRWVGQRWGDCRSTEGPPSPVGWSGGEGDLLAASERGKEGGFYKIAREKIAAFTGEMAKRTKNGKHLHQNIENRREIK